MPPFYGTNEMFGDHHEGIGSILKKRLRYIYRLELGDVVSIFGVKMERPPKQGTQTFPIKTARGPIWVKQVSG